jgi:hypothetical protein
LYKLTRPVAEEVHAMTEAIHSQLAEFFGRIAHVPPVSDIEFCIDIKIDSYFRSGYYEPLATPGSS